MHADIGPGLRVAVSTTPTGRTTVFVAREYEGGIHLSPEEMRAVCAWVGAQGA